VLSLEEAYQLLRPALIAVANKAKMAGLTEAQFVDACRRVFREAGKQLPWRSRGS